MSLVIAAYELLMHNVPPFYAVVFGTFFLHLFLYFGIYSLYFFLESMPSMQKYRIQQDKKPTEEMRWNAFIKILWGDIWPQLPMMFLTYPTLTWLGSRMEPPYPSWLEMGMYIGLFFLAEDTWFYWIHRLLHWGPFYKYIHKIHHEHTFPFGMVAEYAHPIEVLILGFGTFMGPFIFKVHLLTVWVWLFFRLWQEIDCHSGFDFPWSGNRWIPGFGGADFHDFHHMNFVGNYASTFRWWDWMMGTDGKYHQFKAKKNASKQE